MTLKNIQWKCTTSKLQCGCGCKTIEKEGDIPVCPSLNYSAVPRWRMVINNNKPGRKKIDMVPITKCPLCGCKLHLIQDDIDITNNYLYHKVISDCPCSGASSPVAKWMVNFNNNNVKPHGGSKQ